VRPGADCRRHDRLRRRRPARADRIFSQRVLQWHVQHLYDANISEGPRSIWQLVWLSPVLGGLGVVFLVERFARGGQRPWRSGGDGRGLLQAGDIRGLVARSIAGFGLSIGSGAAVGREGRSFRSARRWGRFFPGHQALYLAKDHAAFGRSRRWDCRDFQHTARWRAVRPGNSVARGFEPHLSSGRVATGAATSIGRILIGLDPAFVVPDIQSSLSPLIGFEEAIALSCSESYAGIASWHSFGCS